MPQYKCFLTCGAEILIISEFPPVKGTIGNGKLIATSKFWKEHPDAKGCSLKGKIMHVEEVPTF